MLKYIYPKTEEEFLTTSSNIIKLYVLGEIKREMNVYEEEKY